MSSFKEGARLTGGALVAGIATTLVLLILASMWIFGWGFLSQQTADFRGETGKKNQVEGSGAYRIAAYDRFFDQCAAVQAIEDKIANQRTQAESLPKSEQPRIATNVNALLNTRAEAIRQYNADARKSYTSGQFRSSDLPFQLDITAKETTCTA